MLLRAARPSDLPRLTEVAHAAKRSWGYPESWIARWQDALTFTEATLREQEVFVVEKSRRVAGVCGLRPGDPEWELEHLWVLPRSMGQGVGSLLLDHARAVARAAGADSIRIVSDPHAEYFYLNRGALRVGNEASSIPGRKLPVLRLSLGRSGHR